MLFFVKSFWNTKLVLNSQADLNYYCRPAGLRLENL